MCIAPCSDAQSMRDTQGARATSSVAAADARRDTRPDSLVVLRRWTIRDGLPQQSVTRLAFDEKGFLWGATFGGLVRFDGERVESFGLARLPFLSSNTVTALAPARSGGLWIGATQGLVVRMRDGRGERILPIPGVMEPIVAITEGGDGAVWAVSARRLDRWDGARWRRMTAGVSIADVMTALLPLGGDSLLYGDTRGLFVITGDRAAPLAPDDSLLARPMSGALVRDRRGRIWAGVADGVVTWAPGGRAQRVARITASVQAIVEDGRGTLWVAAPDTIWRIDSPAAEATTPVARVVSTVPARHLALAMTHDGVLVAGTGGDGLIAYIPRMVRRLRLREGGSSREASNVIGDGAGGLLVSSGCEGSMRFDSAFRPMPSRPEHDTARCVRSFARDGRGRLWRTTLRGLFRLDPGERWVQVPLPDDPLHRNARRPMLALGGDSLLLGAPGGGIVLVTDDSVARPWPAWRPRAATEITALARGPDGAVWVGQVARVARVAAGRREHLDSVHGVPAGAVRAILAERDGGVWVGTYGGGLALLDPGRRPPRRVPLSDGTVIAIVPDVFGNRWLLQNQGLAVLRRDALDRWRVDPTATPPVTTFGDLPDMAEGNNGNPAAWPLSGGRLAFVTVDGILVADATRLPPPSPAPSVHLLDVHGAHGALDIGDTLRPVRGDRTLDVRVSAPAFRSPGALRFRYRLEGRDDDYIDLGARRDFLLTDLAAGRYVLQVAMLGLDGATSRARPVVIEVAPFWYEASGTRFGALLVVVGVAAVLIRQRIGVLAARNAALQAQIEARRQAAIDTDRHQRELAQVGRVAMVGEMTAALMHELGQPLSAIVNNAEAARRILRRPDASAALVDETLDDIVGQGVRASQVVTSLRRFLRAGRGVSETIDVTELVAEVAALVRSEFTEHRMTLATRVEPATPAVTGERVLLQQVLVNLLANAADAVRGRGGAVLLRARPAGHGGVRLTVADDGPGVAPGLRATAFDPFVSGKEHGMGMGLAIARRIVEAHGGTIAIGALPGAGAVVSIRLPGPAEVLR